MKFNELRFERKVLPKSTDLKEDRCYIDFIIDGIALSDHVGGIEHPVTPFGWDNNRRSFELESAQRLMNFKKSEIDNGLQSAYVCPQCGDEGCGAVMFATRNHGSYVEWYGFVFSDGYPTDSEPDEEIKNVVFYFEIGSYQRAIGKLKSMIKS